MPSPMDSESFCCLARPLPTHLHLPHLSHTTSIPRSTSASLHHRHHTVLLIQRPRRRTRPARSRAAGTEIETALFRTGIEIAIFRTGVETALSAAKVTGCPFLRPSHSSIRVIPPSESIRVISPSESFGAPRATIRTGLTSNRDEAAGEAKHSSRIRVARIQRNIRVAS